MSVFILSFGIRRKSGCVPSRSFCVLQLCIVVIMILFYTNLSHARDYETGDTRAAYFKQLLKSDTVSPIQKLNIYDTLLCLLPNEMPELLLCKANLLRDMSNPGYTKEALKMYEKIRDMKNLYDLREQSEATYSLAELYLISGDPLNALKSAGRLMTIPLPDSLKYYRINGYLSLSNIFRQLEDDEKFEHSIMMGMKHLEAESDIISESQYKVYKSALLSQKAALMIIKENFQEALNLFLEAKRLNPKISDTIDVNIGSMYSTQKHHDIALQYFMSALNSSNSEVRGVAAFNIALGYAQEGLYDQYFDFINTHAKELDYWSNHVQAITLSAIKSEAYEKLGDFKNALIAQRVADSLRNEIMPDEKIREIEREYAKIEMAEKDASLKTIADKYDKSNKMMWCVLALLLAACVVLVVVMCKLRREKQEKFYQREEYERHIEDLNDALEMRNQEMSSMAMRLASMSEKLENLREVVSDSKSKKNEIIDAVNSTLRQVSSEKEVWNTFMEYFEGVNQSFFDRLHVLHPDLTNAEIRMCAFILLNRTNKEIATILNRSTRTVETIKYNLRKKLGITVPTESYLRSISSGETGT